MTFSKLISGTVPHHNKHSPRYGTSIIRAVPHHWAGLGGGIERLTNPNEQASANYIIESNGRILGQVPEEFRAWTSGSWAADAPSITIEIQNSGGQINGNDDDLGSWRVSDAALRSLIALLADLSERYGWGGVGPGQVRGHREFAATACPGGFLWHQFPYVREQANLMITGVPDAPQPPIRARKDMTMLGLMIGDGKGLYGKKGARYFKTFDSGNRTVTYLTHEDANSVAANMGPDTPFANVTYKVWDAYDLQADTFVDATVEPPVRLSGPKGKAGTKTLAG